VAYDIGSGTERSSGKPRDFDIDHISVLIRTPKNDVGVAIGRRTACADFGEMLI
jgi:hypothetical protein